MPQTRENICMMMKDLYPECIKKLQSSIQKKQKYLKWGKDFNWHFTKEDIQMENKFMKRCSTLLVMTEMHIQAIVRQHLILLALNSFFFFTIISVGKDWEQQECSHTAGGNATWHNHYGRLNKCFFLHPPKFTFTLNLRVWPYLVGSL